MMTSFLYTTYIIYAYHTMPCYIIDVLHIIVWSFSICKLSNKMCAMYNNKIMLTYAGGVDDAFWFSCGSGTVKYVKGMIER
jgi:hypothetical protein